MDDPKPGYAGLPPLIGVAEAARLAGMHRDTFRRWIVSRELARDRDGNLLYPNLLQRQGPRRWLVQVEELGRALGRTKLDLEAMVVETAARVDQLERRFARFEQSARR